MRTILKRPIITEKTNLLSDQYNKFTFEVNRDANKIEIKKAVEDQYNVEVTKVNTMVMPRKARRRYTKTGIVSGRTNLQKKAIVTLADGDFIDFYADI